MWFLVCRNNVLPRWCAKETIPLLVCRLDEFTNLVLNLQSRGINPVFKFVCYLQYMSDRSRKLSELQKTVLWGIWATIFPVTTELCFTYQCSPYSYAYNHIIWNWFVNKALKLFLWHRYSWPTLLCIALALFLSKREWRLQVLLYTQCRVCCEGQFSPQCIYSRNINHKGWERVLKAGNQGEDRLTQEVHRRTGSHLFCNYHKTRGAWVLYNCHWNYILWNLPV